MYTSTISISLSLGHMRTLAGHGVHMGIDRQTDWQATCSAMIIRAKTGHYKRCENMSLTNLLQLRSSVWLKSARGVCNSRSFCVGLHDRIAGRQRFYKQVGVEEVAPKSGLYKITLDGRTLRTPARNDLHLPSEELASVIALEWDAQVDKRRGIVPASMPHMILASTAIDQLRTDPSHARDTCLRFLPTDAALFHTSPEDRILLKAQKTHFNPLIRWMKKSFGASLSTTSAIGGRIAHPTETTQRVRHIVHSLDHFELACLQAATMECKSLVMALALVCRYIDFQQATEASRVEEEFQAEIWGTVEGGHDLDRLNNRVNLSSVDTFMSLYWEDVKLAEKLNTWKEELQNS